jgi:hypothetical protein
LAGDERFELSRALSESAMRAITSIASNYFLVNNQTDMNANNIPKILLLSIGSLK